MCVVLVNINYVQYIQYMYTGLALFDFLTECLAMLILVNQGESVKDNQKRSYMEIHVHKCDSKEVSRF